MNSDLLELFKSPPNSYRAKPFWSWNGRLDKDELLRQVHVIRDMGFGGFFMHSRTGLVTEYLGEEWFDLINACADEGAKLGLESWLYDEDRWPSGTGGGMVTKEPRFRLKFLRLTKVPAEEFEWSDGLVAAFACDLDGLSFTNCVQLDADTAPGKYAGRTVLAFTTEEQARSSFYNGYTYLDTMNREGTERFIELTHEKYLAHCGDRIGASIKGIFTDEPHRGSLMDGFSVGNDAPQWLVPWTYTVFDEFSRRFGYDLVPLLPELFLQPEGRAISPVKWHYVELLQQLFLENWAQPLDAWCRDHNLVLTGHILHEDSLSAQTDVTGSVMRYYEHMEYPGIDILTEGNQCYWAPKMLASVARQVGRKWLLSELDGCTGWQMPFEGHKAIGDWQALFGINLRCPHLSWYTMQGEAKRDFPASILHQSAWWRDYGYVETYFARMGVMNTAGAPDCELLVLDPVESVWCQVYPGWARMLGTTDPDIRALEEQYTRLFHTLTAAQLDFDYGNEDIVKRHGKVEAAGDGVLRVGHMTYRAVVVGGMVTIRSTTLDLLESFVDAGGTVIFAGEPPRCVDALPSDRAVRLADRARRVPFEDSAITAACDEAVRRAVTVADSATGAPLGEVFCQVRRDGDTRIVMAVNIDRAEWVRDAVVRIAADVPAWVEEWDCATGERFRVPADMRDGALEFHADFPPAGSRIYVVRPECDESLRPRPEYETVSMDILEGPFDYALAEPNVCVLDFARFRVDDGPWQPAREVLKVDQAVRDSVGLPHRGGEMYQPWFTLQKECPKLADVALQFDFHVDERPEGALELVIERPEEFEILVNGEPLEQHGTGWWVDVCFKRLKLSPELLRQGENLVEIRTAFNEASDLEALHLLGNFGVRVEGGRRFLTRLPETLAPGSVVDQGLPFYGGALTYYADLPLRPNKGERLFVTTPAFGAACVKAGGEGSERAMIAWQPYEADVTGTLTAGRFAIETVLTRRNTFGPLHQVPALTPGYGPGNFVSEGAGFTENYQLLPAGLLEPPRVSIRRTAG